jgi:cytochrome c oxidase subunit I
MKLKIKSYQFFLITAVLIFLSSFFVSNQALDIHMHDTYLIISWSHIYWGLVLMLLFLWILYVCMNQWMYSKRLSLIHIILTITTIVLIVVMLFMILQQFHKGLAGMPRHYYDYGNSYLNTYYSLRKSQQTLTLIAVILSFGQIIFPINLIVGIIKIMRTKAKSNNTR